MVDRGRSVSYAFICLGEGVQSIGTTGVAADGPFKSTHRFAGLTELLIRHAEEEMGLTARRVLPECSIERDSTIGQRLGLARPRGINDFAHSLIDRRLGTGLVALVVRLDGPITISPRCRL